MNMKNLTKKAFSVAEIIVANSVLLTLGWVSFASMEWYIDTAKNVKVSHDLSNLATKIEITTLSGKQQFYNLVVTDSEASKNNKLPDNAYINSWNVINAWNSQYNVWNINFINLWEKRWNFKDIQWRDYIFAYIISKNFIKTELAGSITDKDGNNVSLVKWTYYPVSTSDTRWLITSYWENNFEIVESWKRQYIY